MPPFPPKRMSFSILKIESAESVKKRCVFLYRARSLYKIKAGNFSHVLKELLRRNFSEFRDSVLSPVLWVFPFHKRKALRALERRAVPQSVPAQAWILVF